MNVYRVYVLCWFFMFLAMVIIMLSIIAHDFSRAEACEDLGFDDYTSMFNMFYCVSEGENYFVVPVVFDCNFWGSNCSAHLIRGGLL